MGIISEEIAQKSVNQLELILIAALKNKVNMKFASKYFYEWYLDECADAWAQPNNVLVEKYGVKNL